MIIVSIFASGGGTNALNLLEASKSLANVRIASVVIDTSDSALLKILPVKFPSTKIHHLLPDSTLKGEARKSEHESRILAALKDDGVEWVLLAGYMRLIGSTLLNAMRNRIINIHPSLLPLYPGIHSYERAFADNVKESGVTIHLVDEGVDTGPVLLQRSFPRLPTDSLQDFIERGKKLEWEMYPQILQTLSTTSQLGASYVT